MFGAVLYSVPLGLVTLYFPPPPQSSPDTGTSFSGVGPSRPPGPSGNSLQNFLFRHQW